MYKDFKYDTWKKFDEDVKNNSRKDKELIIFGASGSAKSIIPYLKIKYKIAMIIDNCKDKWETSFEGIKVFSPEILKNIDLSNYVVLICSVYVGSISIQLEKMGIKNYYSSMWLNKPDEIDYRIQNNIEKNKINDFKKLLCDEKSKNILKEIVRKRETGFLDYTDIRDKGEYFRNEFFTPLPDEVLIDAGAFNGDTIKEFVNWNCGNFKKIYAFEADPFNYGFLQKSMIKSILNERIETFNMGVWDKKEKVKISANNMLSSTFMPGGDWNYKLKDINTMIEIDCIDLDTIIDDKVTFLKMDIEGSEMKALRGGKEIIKTCKPRCVICIYHKPEDLWDIPLYIHSLVPEYKFYIRHHSYRFYDTVLYAY